MPPSSLSQFKDMKTAIILGLFVAVGCFFLSGMMEEKSLLLFILPLGVSLAWLCVLFPHFTFLIILALIPMDTFAYLAGLGASLSLFKILTPLAAIGYLKLRFTSKEIVRSSLDSVEITFLIYAAYCFLLIPFAEELHYSFTFGRKLASFIILYFLATRLSEIGPKEFPRHMLLTLLGSALLSGAFSFYSTLSGANIFSHFQDSNLVRTTGASNISPNDYAYVLFLPIALAMLGFFSHKGKWRLFYTVCAGGLLATLLFTYSRSAVVAFGAASVVLMFILGSRIKGEHLAVLLILLVVGSFFLPQTFKQRMLTLASLSNTPATGQELSLVRRGNYYVISMAVLKRFPLLGAGPGNFPAIHASVEYQSIPAFYGSQRMPHNLYLQVATETGLVGLVLFMTPVTMLFFRLRKQISEADSLTTAAPAACMLLALLSTLSMGMFLHLLLHKTFWIIMALCTLSLRGTPPCLKREEEA